MLLLYAYMKAAATLKPKAKLKTKAAKKPLAINYTILLTIAKYAILGLGIFALSNASFYTIRPFGAAFYLALALLGTPIVIIAPFFLAAEVAAGGVFGLLAALLITLLSIGAKYLKGYLKRSERPTKWLAFTLPILAALCSAAFMSLTGHHILHILLYAALCLCMLHATRIALKPILIEKLKYKMLEVEVICFCIIIIAAGLGLAAFSIFGFPLALLIGSYCVFIAAKTAGPPRAIVIALLFGMGHSLFALNITPLAAYVFIAALGVAFVSAPKAIMPLAALAGYLIFQFFFFEDTAYVVLWISAVGGAALAYMLTPNSVMQTLKNYLFEKHDKAAVRYMMQQDRAGLAHRLSSAASVFYAMSDAVTIMERPLPSYKGSLKNKCCAICEHEKACKANEARDAALEEMLSTVFEKGRATIADIPPYLTEHCVNLAKLIGTATNICENRRTLISELDSEKKSRAIVAHQMHGMSGVLKNLAASTQAEIKTDFTRENVLVEELNYAGIACAQSLIAEDCSVLVLRTETYDKKAIEKITTRVLGRPYTVSGLDDTLLSGFCAVTLKARPRADVVFGVAAASKVDGEVSGDTHSFIKIGQNRFMMALGDGMGSGEKARTASSTAVGLVENFYRAGFSGELVLKSVNRFLSSSASENFSALDICVINLDSLALDVVKLASPATYVKRKDTVERIDGSSAPIGMLDTIEPTALNLNLTPGDMVVLASDGISESFNGDKLAAAINNLRTLNTQTLAEGILETAQFNRGGKLGDDSTVLVARVVEMV